MEGPQCGLSIDFELWMTGKEMALTLRQACKAFGLEFRGGYVRRLGDW